MRKLILSGVLATVGTLGLAPSADAGLPVASVTVDPLACSAHSATYDVKVTNPNNVPVQASVSVLVTNPKHPYRVLTTNGGSASIAPGGSLEIEGTYRLGSGRVNEVQVFSGFVFLKDVKQFC